MQSALVGLAAGRFVFSTSKRDSKMAAQTNSDDNEMNHRRMYPISASPHGNAFAATVDAACLEVTLMREIV